MLALGAVLIVLGLLLGVAEAHLGTGGLIAVGAAAALVGGLVLLLAGAGAGVLALVAVAGVACVASAGGFLMLIRGIRPAGRIRPRSGTEAMIGRIGVMRVGDSANVFVDGGLWRASPSPLDDRAVLRNGDRVVIDYVKGLTLYVHKAEELELSP